MQEDPMRHDVNDDVDQHNLSYVACYNKCHVITSQHHPDVNQGPPTLCIRSTIGPFHRS